MVAAIIAWLVTCRITEGDINVANLGADYPMLAGNVAALGVSLIVTTIMSFVAGEDFDWEVMRTGIKMIEADGTDKLAEDGAHSVEGLNKALTYVPRLEIFIAGLQAVHAYVRVCGHTSIPELHSASSHIPNLVT